jgi:hypothetical protein
MALLAALAMARYAASPASCRSFQLCSRSSAYTSELLSVASDANLACEPVAWKTLTPTVVKGPAAALVPEVLPTIAMFEGTIGTTSGCPCEADAATVAAAAAVAAALIAALIASFGATTASWWLCDLNGEKDLTR